MFIYQENIKQKKRLERIFKKVKLIYGDIPPQMLFLGNIDAEYLEDFLKSVVGVVKHPHIESDLFGFIRLFVAFREDYEYCKNFNTHFLLQKGYEQEVLDQVIDDITQVPFDARHKELAKFAIRSIYDSKNIQESDFRSIYDLGWSQKDLFDLISHTGDIFKNGRILTAYSKKEVA